MRLNLPVLDEEFPFPKGEALVSTTDLKGRITYCNQSFIEVSGYTREELLGQPHNLIRHPDMPAEGFRDLWATIERGRPWSGLVKNRRKDGRHYWVVANVTPIMVGDRPVGYLSVRGEATRSQIQTADALYAALREEDRQGRTLHRLHAGRVLRTDWRGRMQEALRLGYATRLSLGAFALAGLGIGAGLALGHLQASGPYEAAGALAAGLVAGTAGAAWLRHHAVQPVLALLRATNRMAAGDMTQALHSDRDDLMGQFTASLNQLNMNLRSIVADARHEVERMRVAARDIAAGNQDLAERTLAQASHLQDTAASMDAMTGTLGHSADIARQANDLAGQANGVTVEGSQAVQQVASTMHQISDSSNRISEIIGVIDGVAFQTNILALNAAVEAARAGEQGRGFAVVAGEVRALAQRTSRAAREVKQIIDDSVQRVAAGNQLTQSAAHTMDDATRTVQQVSGLISDISQATRHQLDGIAGVSQAVNGLEAITQKNAALVEQIAAAALQLEHQASAVAQAVGVFRVDADQAQDMPDAVALRREMKRLPSPH